MPRHHMAKVVSLHAGEGCHCMPCCLGAAVTFTWHVCDVQAVAIMDPKSFMAECSSSTCCLNPFMLTLYPMIEPDETYMACMLQSVFSTCACMLSILLAELHIQLECYKVFICTSAALCSPVCRLQLSKWPCCKEVSGYLLCKAHACRTLYGLMSSYATNGLH
jgi:hypothetical protein